MKVLIVGGVAGGATAAARLRRLDETAEIIILERSGYISYANCGLPYYIGGVIQDKSALTLQSPESFFERFRIDVRVKHEAIAIHADRKCVSVKNLESGSVYEESYDKLLLSPGARPIRPNLPGINSNRVFTLRTVEDALQIRAFIENTSPKSAVVVGGGYIGLEMAENLMHAGIQPTIVQLENQVMAPLDYDVACQIHAYLKTKGVTLYLGNTVEAFMEADNAIISKLKSGKPITSDMVILAAGITPDTQLAKDAGLSLGIKDAIQVNETMETSIKDIYAVGDAVEVNRQITKKPDLISLAGPANKQARIAADAMCGIHSQYFGAQGTSIIKLIDMAVATTGLNEKQLQNAGVSYDKVITFSADHASYYPDASNLTIKTLFQKETGTILGAQIWGFSGVDKRCDVLATAIHAGMTANQLTELELAYAPPFSSAKDPVNMAGYVMQNVLDGLVRQFHWHDVKELVDHPNVTLLDVRTAAEFKAGHIKSAFNIPLDDLRNRLSELNPQKPVFVNCQSGLRNYIACRILSQNGFRCYNLSGGYRYYSLASQDSSYPLQPAHPCGIQMKSVSY